MTCERDIPVTTPARTLLDLAGVIAAGRLERAVMRAEDLRLFDLGALRATLKANSGRPGGPALAAIVERGLPGLELTRSDSKNGSSTSAPITGSHGRR